MHVRLVRPEPAGVRIWKNNGLSIVLFGLFLLFWAGQTLAGWSDENETLRQHGNATLTLAEYICSGSFLEATTENWLAG